MSDIGTIARKVTLERSAPVAEEHDVETGTVDFSECCRHALTFYRRVRRATRTG